MVDTPFQVALLLDGESVPGWMGRALERLISDTEATVELLVINEAVKNCGKTKLRTGVQDPAWASVYLAHELGRERFGDASLRESRPISSISGVSDPERIYCEPLSRDGFGNYLPAEVISEIKGKFDVVIRQGFGIIAGDILTAARHGVLSFHHGDIRKHRGRPPGFWEYLEGESKAGVTLQKLTETLDGGQIVTFEDVDIRQAKTWWEVERRIFEKSTGMLVDGIRKLQDPNIELTTPGELGRLDTVPSWGAALKYHWRTANALIGQAKPLSSHQL